jgi:hypothetical protein
MWWWWEQGQRRTARTWPWTIAESYWSPCWLKKLLNHCFTYAALGSVIKRTFSAWNWWCFVWNIIFRANSCQLQTDFEKVICTWVPKAKFHLLFCLPQWEMKKFHSLLLFCHVPDIFNGLLLLLFSCIYCFFARSLQKWTQVSLNLADRALFFTAVFLLLHLQWNFKNKW